MARVMALLAVIFLAVPIIELALIIKIGATIGVLNTIGLLVLSSVVGAWLMKREGLGVMRRMQASVAEGRVPGSELVDGFLILFGGALMMAPGFLTDILGMALLLPPVRFLVRRLVRRRLAIRVTRVTGGTGTGSGGGGAGIIDL
jgi:UPF0716 protein FxsA